MALILCVETSSKNCSVSISRDGVVIYTIEEIKDSFLHGRKLHVFCKDLLSKCGLNLSEIDAYALSIGPGSYTGLRIGTSTVKGFSFVFKKPIIAIPTLSSMAFSRSSMKDVLLCPIIDSRKGEVYASIYDNNFECILSSHPHVLSPTSFSKYLEKNKILFFGTGVGKIMEYISNKNAIFEDNFFPSSKYLATLAEMKYDKNEFSEINSLEPLYLKDFITNSSKN